MPTILQEIVGDSARQKYRGGDSVRFSLARTGGKAGLDATTPYRWSVKQHHNQHVHFVITEYVGDDAMLEIPNDGHGAGVSLWYEVELTMLTDQGQTVRASRNLLPDVVVLDIRSSPTGAEMFWNGVAQDSTQPFQAVIGQRFVLEAPQILYHGKTKNSFVRWEISGGEDEDETRTERSLELLVTGEDKQYVAYYEFVGSSLVNYLPSVKNSGNAPLE
jgi:hypothetical protein